MLYPKLCYNEPCYKEVEVYLTHKDGHDFIPMLQATSASSRLSLYNPEFHLTSVQDVVTLSTVQSLGLLNQQSSSLARLLGKICNPEAKLSSDMRKPAFCICENKGADQRFFRYIDCIIPLLPKSEISSL